MIMDETATHTIDGQDEADIAQAIQVASALVAAKYTRSMQSLLGSPIIGHVRMDVIITVDFDEPMDTTTITAHATNIPEQIISPTMTPGSFNPTVYGALRSGTVGDPTEWSSSALNAGDMAEAEFMKLYVKGD